MTAMGAVVMLAVLMARGVGIVLQVPCEVCVDGSVRVPVDSGQELYPAGLDHLACTASDASADEHLDPLPHEDLPERTVGETIVPDDPRRNDPVVLDVIDLELLRPSEVLEYIPVLISDCDLHEDSD